MPADPPPPHPTLLTLLLLNTITPKAKAVFPVGPPQGGSAFITTFSPVHKAGASTRPGREKKIVLWTQFFGSQDWLAGLDPFHSCVVKGCRLTTEKEEVGEADAVLMNVRDIYSPSDLPPHHPPHQVWIIHGSEPPYYIYINLESFNNVFNWTSWYRSDADIFSPYGHYTPVSPVKDLKPQDNSTQQHPVPTPDNFQPNFFEADFNHRLSIPPSDDSKDDDPYSRHDLLVFWAASSCINYSQRYKLVTQLQKFLPVNTYGGCGTKVCQRGAQECDELLRRYKFVLAFENGYCRDYVTEKYWNALTRNQIPIVSGGADYSQITIPGSYIDVDNFSSVEELAKFIQQVAADRHLYNSFFEWKSRYRTLGYGICNWCQLCASLHDDAKPPQVYSDFRGWLAADSCPLQSKYQHFRWFWQYAFFKIFGI